MDKNHYSVIGVMSGTSLDGIDLSYITFTFNEKWKFEIHTAETIPYSDKWARELKDLVSMTIKDLKKLDEDYTNYLGEVIGIFIKKHKLLNIDAVCSHGHTALHQPQNGITYQIGNLPNLATLTNQTIVCDFRVEDVQLGGQGAPLVPIGDKLLFSEYDFCVNLGGFANISTNIGIDRIAYDICPVNIVLNHYVNQLGLNYDDKGQLAAIGSIHSELLNRLNTLGFYQQKPPKSLGFEWVKSEIFPLIDSFHLQLNDILRTVVEHISIQVSKEINSKENAKALFTGGGVCNDFLMERIKAQTKNRVFIPHQTLLEFKEALIFGFLGVLKLRNEINCLSSVTGASMDHSSGKIYYP